MKDKLFTRYRWPCWLAVLACAVLMAAPAQADPAGRIGRVAWLSGTLNLYNPGTGESFSAPLNQPLTSGDVLSTEAGSRAEIQIGSLTVRLDAGSSLNLVRIDDEQIRLDLDDGRLIAKLPSREAAGDFALTTRDGRFSAREPGTFRFDTDANSTVATVYAGALHFTTSDSAVDIGSGQSVQFWFSGQTFHRQLPPTNDDFTQWSAARDQRPAAKIYSRYVSPEMTGAEDLDAYGNWSESPEYGAIWTPRAVAADWAPYRTGHWVWIDPWGWNWVGNEPWGFAPFHYGRWVQHRGAWCWVPGERVVRPVYAPALVAWIGTPGAGLALSVGARSPVGWFPLAPREVYVPGYRSSANYVRNINITHVSHITNVTNIVNSPQMVVEQMHYAHRAMPQAVTVVPGEVLTQRRPVESARLSPREQQSWRELPVHAGAPVSAPPRAAQVDTRGRPERPEQNADRHEGRSPPTAFPTGPGRAVPPTPAAPPPAPVGAPQRGERSLPESSRAAPSKPDAFVPQRQDVAPATLVPPPATVETRGRPERPEQNADRHERQSPPIALPSAPGKAAPTAPATLAPAPAPVGAPQRGERPLPESSRPAPSRPESLGPRRPDVAPATPVPPPAAVEARGRQERPEPPVARRESERAGPVVPTAPVNRTGPTPAPLVMPQPRNERPMPDTVRPVPRETHVEARPPAAPQAAPVRVEPPPPVVREQRHDAPAAVGRPPELPSAPRPQPSEERQRPAQNDRERPQRNDGERH